VGDCKKLVVKVIPSRIANPFVRRVHYSGRVATTSQVHFGVFYNGGLHGVLSFGPSLDKSKTIGLVEGTAWNGFLELNRLAFDDVLPRNSESRAISVCMKLLKRNAPHVEWIISFADGCQCGDGTIYRASGFVLTGIRENKSIVLMPNGEIVHKFQLRSTANSAIYRKYGGRGECEGAMIKRIGAKFLEGFQLRYIYFINKSKRADLTVPEIPFSEIAARGAKMYLGKPSAGSVDGDTSAIPAGKGGSIPTPALKLKRLPNGEAQTSKG